jgi:hypothetical protein
MVMIACVPWAIQIGGEGCCNLVAFQDRRQRAFGPVKHEESHSGNRWPRTRPGRVKLQL